MHVIIIAIILNFHSCLHAHNSVMKNKKKSIECVLDESRSNNFVTNVEISFERAVRLLFVSIASTRGYGCVMTVSRQENSTNTSRLTEVTRTN